jgi:hypothetical protein
VAEKSEMRVSFDVCPAHLVVRVEQPLTWQHGWCMREPSSGHGEGRRCDQVMATATSRVDEAQARWWSTKVNAAGTLFAEKARGLRTLPLTPLFPATVRPVPLRSLGGLCSKSSSAPFATRARVLALMRP